MPNPIKYTTGSETLALKKGNFYIGTGDVGKGPSDTTGFYQGISPSEGGYVIYMNREGAPGSLSYHSAANDSELISFTNSLANTSFTSATQCLNYYATQTDKVCVNRDYEGIVTDGLVLNLDAGFTPSYSRSGTTWTDLSLSGNNGTLINGPTFNSDNGGSIVFDGTNDYVNLPNSITFGTNPFTIRSIFYLTSFVNNNIEHGLFQSVDNISFPSHHTVFLTVRQDIGQEGIIRFCVRDTTANQNEINISSTTLQTGIVYDIHAIRDNNTIYVYLNGSLIASQTNGNNMDILTPTLTTIGVTANIVRFLIGRIYLTQIYNRALSADEVLQNFNAQKGRFGL